jgi:hypothetical protein
LRKYFLGEFKKATIELEEIYLFKRLGELKELASYFKRRRYSI